MTNVTKPHSNQIVVTCTSGKLWNKLHYKNFHLVAAFSNDTDNFKHFSDKISFWKNCRVSRENTSAYCKTIQKHGSPPNVLLIGIDSTSRLNFHRFLKKTVNVLEKKLGAVEMTGYTKGYNAK